MRHPHDMSLWKHQHCYKNKYSQRVNFVLLQELQGLLLNHLFLWSSKKGTSLISDRSPFSVGRGPCHCSTWRSISLSSSDLPLSVCSCLWPWWWKTVIYHGRRIRKKSPTKQRQVNQEQILHLLYNTLFRWDLAPKMGPVLCTLLGCPRKLVKG